MPYIKVRGLEVEQVQSLSAQLTPLMAQIIGCPEDWLCFIHTSECAFTQGKAVAQEVFFHVEWFERGQGVKDALAQVLTQGVQKMRPTVETTTVVFVPQAKEDFFENGAHY